MGGVYTDFFMGGQDASFQDFRERDGRAVGRLRMAEHCWDGGKLDSLGGFQGGRVNQAYCIKRRRRVMAA